MLKELPYKPVLLTLLTWMLFGEVRETLTGERPLFIYRWLYTDRSHAKNIEVLTYLLTDEQVAYMLLHPNDVIQQPSNKDLRFKYVNVVLRIRNLTGGIASGRLSWGIGKDEAKLVDIVEIPILGQAQKYSNIVIPIGIVIVSNNNLLPEPILIKWKELYVVSK